MASSRFSSFRYRIHPTTTRRADFVTFARIAELNRIPKPDIGLASLTESFGITLQELSPALRVFELTRHARQDSERQKNRLEILDLVENPGAGKRPVVLDRRNGHTQGFGCFLICHPYEITQFDNLGLSRMVLGEVVQYFMDG